MKTEIDEGDNKIKKLEEIFNEAVNRLELEDQVGKEEMDQMRVLFNEKVKELNEADENIKNDIEGLRAFFTDETKENRDMKGFRIENLADPVNEEDATNKKYVDEKTAENNLFKKHNNIYFAQRAIDMNLKNIFNLPPPTASNDAAHKLYVDSAINETKRELSEFKEYDEKRVYTFLGTSIILIRGEAKGPIIGINEIKNINRRRPTPDGRFVALDGENNPITPSIVYFGKYDGGEVEYDNQGGKINIKLNYLIPFEGSIINCSLTFIHKDDLFENSDLEIFFRINEFVDAYEIVDYPPYYVERENIGPYDYENIDYSNGIINSQGFARNYKFEEKGFLSGIEGEKIQRACLSPPKLEHMIFKECSSIILYFGTRHPDAERVFITLAAQIHIPSYNENFLPKGWKIL